MLQKERWGETEKGRVTDEKNVIGRASLRKKE